MKYYLDTEFLEGEQSRRVFGIKIGNTKPTIDLISIGLVAEDGREYYAISKDFNLNEAWNRYDVDDKGIKTYWIRENVLKPIFQELLYSGHKNANLTLPEIKNDDKRFNIKNVRKLINHFGKTNKEIAQEVFEFCTQDTISLEKAKYYNMSYENKDIEFYTYYGDYDWVVFCWIFGKMIDLPKGFPKYSIDLKQILDEKALTTLIFQLEGKTIKDGITELKNNPNYPAPYNEHNALSDARWNKKLHEFLIK